MEKALYIHIPFCLSRCLYCDFYSSLFKAGSADSFCRALFKQIETLRPGFETIYLGGGTPTALEINLLKKLFRKLNRLAAEAKEFTVEANPESLSETKIKLFLDHRVNRISIGCQSFRDGKLKFLGRAHTAKQAIVAVEKAKKSGFDNISLDLIFGLPGETDKTWQNELSQAVKLPITHLSLYMLTYEKKTKLFNQLKNKDFLPLAEATRASMYKNAVKFLSEKKINRYEISNFAKKGFECRHNFFYWKNEPYLGLGPSAVSFSGEKRQRNISSLSGYINAVENKKQIWEYSEKLSSFKKAKETAALKIRTSRGIDFRWFKEKTGFDFLVLEQKVLTELLANKLIRYNQKKERVFLTKKGFLFADTVSSAFL